MSRTVLIIDDEKALSKALSLKLQIARLAY